MTQIKINTGDCLYWLKKIGDFSIDAIICDPPYGLKFMSKGWDNIGDGSQQREWHREWLKEAYRVLKPNGVIKAFSGSRTFHHLIAMMEEIGFKDLRVEAWSYGSGFPNSHNLNKALDKHFGFEVSDDGYRPNHKNKTHGKGWGGGRKTSYSKPKSEKGKQWEGWGTALKPAWEPVCIGFKL